MHSTPHSSSQVGGLPSLQDRLRGMQPHLGKDVKLARFVPDPLPPRGQDGSRGAPTAGLTVTYMFRALSDSELPSPTPTGQGLFPG